jgi:hypothetical protein
MHVLCIGLYFIACLKIFFQEQRPFWVNKDLVGEESKFLFITLIRWYQRVILILKELDGHFLQDTHMLQ